MFGDQSQANAQASGVSRDYFAPASLRIGEGRALTTADDDKLAAVACSAHGVTNGGSRLAFYPKFTLHLI